MNYPRRHTCWWSKTLLERGHLRGEQQGQGTQDCSASWFTVSGFMEEGLISGLSLPHHLACVHVWSDSGLFQVACKSPGEARFQYESFREVGRTYYSPASPPSFRPLPNSSGWQQLVISLFLIGTFPWETTCASGCFHPWSGQKVSVHGSLTLFHLNAKVDLLLTIFQMKKLGYSGCIVFSRSLTACLAFLKMSSLRPLPYFVLSGLCVPHTTCQCVPVSCTLYWLSSWAFTSFFRCLRVEIVSCIFCILHRDMKLCKFSNFKSLKSKILFPLRLSKLMLSEVCYNCCITLPSLVITKISDLYLMLMLYFFPFAFVPRLIFYEFIYF